MKKQSLRLVKMPLRNTAQVFAVQARILFLRRQRIILDTDLAELYGVPVKRLNEQVKRNLARFPSDFMFRLTAKEHEVLRSQIATSKTGSGGRRYAPHAFTEHGAIMAANVLNSERAVNASVFVVRAFVRLRDMLTTNRQLAAKIGELEDRLKTHDSTIDESIAAIRRLMAPPEPRRRGIGFQLPAAGSSR